MPQTRTPRDDAPHRDALPTRLRRLLQRWTMPQIDPGDRLEPDLDNVMVHRRAAARMRCMLSPLSGTRHP